MHRVHRLPWRVLVLVSLFIAPALMAQEWITPTQEENAILSASRLGQDINVSVELIDEPTAVVFHRTVKEFLPKDGRPIPPGQLRQARENGNAAARQHLGKVEKEQEKVLTQLLKKEAKILFRTQRTFNGFGINVSAAQVDEIRALPGVKGVHLLPVHTPDNNGSVPFIRAPQAWASTLGLRGDGISIGVIDTGVDYLHTNFGGPGGGYAANNVTTIGDAPNFPGAKVAGGFDFAGNAYNAGGTGAALIPAPDPDPMDCNGHGSHVAGTAGGLGVNSDGTTYSGVYGPSAPFSSMRIGPGVAPAAQIYALKVFGCAGSTLLTAQAIEWAVDPNRDGDFSDHLDVINMSLGSSFGTSFDASAAASDNAVLAGVIVVASAGNAGDTHYIVGSPGTSSRTLTVAASQDDFFLATNVNAPAAIAGAKPIGLPTGWGVALSTPGVTAPVVATVPADACIPVTNGAELAGKIAFINRGGTAPAGFPACGFEVKARYAQNAGAVGVIIGNVATSVSPFLPPGMGSGGIGGVVIPAVSFGTGAADEVRAHLAAGTVNATLASGVTTNFSAIGDLVAGFTSRGLRRIDNALKPDITAPGLAIFSTANGSGNLGVNNQGTSMAAPHIAGLMAVLRQMHPDWSVEELKALAMNTASHDLFLNPAQTPPRYMAARIGAGRANAERAIGADAVLMSDAGDGSVSVSFGALEVLNNGSWMRTLRVVNKGTTSQTFDVSLGNLTLMAGTSFSLPDGNSITVGPGGSATFRVQLTANAALMKHPLDPTSTATQATTSGTLARHYLSESSANVILTLASGSVLRVPVHAILRPASAMGTTQTAFLFADPTAGSFTLNPTGQQVVTGGTLPNDVISFASAFELQGASVDEAGSTGARNAADIKSVGVSTNFPRVPTGIPGSNVYFGISTWGKWSTLFDVEFDIFIDSNRDGIDDYVIFNTTLNDGTNRVDIHGTTVQKLQPPAFPAGQPVFSFINGQNPAVDAVPYNSNVIVLPVRAIDIGLTSAASRFNYRVVSFARGFGGSVDTVSGLTYDPARPGLAFPAGNVTTAGASFYQDVNGTAYPVGYNVANYNASASKGVLLLHHHNADGAREQILSTTAPTATTVTVDAAAGQYSDGVTLRATITPGAFFGQTVSGNVQFSVNGTAVASAAVSSGVASVPYTISLPEGSYTIGASFSSSNAFFNNGSGNGTLTVSRENAMVTPAAEPASVQVIAAGGNANFTLSAAINEVADGSPGNIAFAVPVTVTLVPIGPGGTLTQTATVSVSGTTLNASASFTNVPVNVYDVTFSIGGGYYIGAGSSVLAVFDPSLGFITGGGTVVRNGVRANFGFNVKYQKNGKPQGSFLFMEHRPTGNVKVKGNNMDSLSIVGNTAIFIGKAVVNDVGNHTFRATVVDAGEPGRDDQFGLTVNSPSGAVISDLSFDPMTISGGNIQVPKN